MLKVLGMPCKKTPNCRKKLVIRLYAGCTNYYVQVTVYGARVTRITGHAHGTVQYSTNLDLPLLVMNYGWSMLESEYNVSALGLHILTTVAQPGLGQSIEGSTGRQQTSSAGIPPGFKAAEPLSYCDCYLITQLITRSPFYQLGKLRQMTVKYFVSQGTVQS